jgi:hypothetical protein
MCGSSGSTGFDGPATETNCETLTDNTTLNSLNPEALHGLKVGDILDVRAEGPRGPLVVLNHAGVIVGAITSALVGQILTCIGQGNQYIAEVMRINGGQVIVTIRHQ